MTVHQPEDEPALDIAQGDKALSDHLRNSLKLLREKIDDPAFKQLADDVVAGRSSMRDTFLSDTFAQALDPLVQRGAEEYRNLPEEERERLARLGEEQFAQMREPKPNHPAEPEDPDDPDDFSEQSWLR